MHTVLAVSGSQAKHAVWALPCQAAMPHCMDERAVILQQPGLMKVELVHHHEH